MPNPFEGMETAGSAPVLHRLHDYAGGRGRQYAGGRRPALLLDLAPRWDSGSAADLDLDQPGNWSLLEGSLADDDASVASVRGEFESGSMLLAG